MYLQLKWPLVWLECEPSLERFKTQKNRGHSQVAGYTYCINPSTPGGLLILLHIFMFLFVSRRILGIVNGYISDTKGMGMGWDLDICRWGGGCFEKQNADAKHKYQCSCAYIFPIWENSLTTSVWEHIDIYIYIYTHNMYHFSMYKHTHTHIARKKHSTNDHTPEQEHFEPKNHPNWTPEKSSSNQTSMSLGSKLLHWAPDN